MDDLTHMGLRTYPELLTSAPTDSVYTFEHVENLGSLTFDQVRTWNTYLLKRLDSAAEDWPISACVDHLKNTINNATVEASILINEKVLKLEALTNFMNQGFKGDLKMLIGDVLTRGYGIYRITPKFNQPPVDVNLILSLQQLLRDQISEDIPVVNPKSPGKFKELAEAVGRPPFYDIYRIDPSSVKVEYISPVDGSRPKFRVLRKDGVVISGARVVTRPEEMKSDGMGTLIIRSPVLKAWDNYHKFTQNMSSVDNRINNNSPSVAYEHLPNEKSRPDQPAMAHSIAQGAPVFPEDHGLIMAELEEALRLMSQNAYIRNLESWQENVAILREKVKRGQIRVQDPNFLTRAPILPSHLNNQSLIAPLGQRLVLIPPPPESSMTSEQLGKREDIIFATMGVSKNIFSPPETIGNSSHEQIQEFAKGVSESRKTDINNIVRTFVAYIALDLYLPHIISFISKQANRNLSLRDTKRAVEVEVKRIDATNDLFDQEGSSSGSDSSGTSDSDSDSSSDSDSDSDNDLAGPPQKRQKRMNNLRDVLKLTGSVNKDSEDAFERLGNFSATKEEPEEPTEKDYEIMSLVSSFAVSVSLTPPLSLAQKRAADQAFELGILPTEEMAKILASLIGIPVSKLNTEVPEMGDEEAGDGKDAKGNQKTVQKLADSLASLVDGNTKDKPAQKKTPADGSASSSSSPSSGDGEKAASSTPQPKTERKKAAAASKAKEKQTSKKETERSGARPTEVRKKDSTSSKKRRKINAQSAKSASQA